MMSRAVLLPAGVGDGGQAAQGLGVVDAVGVRGGGLAVST